MLDTKARITLCAYFEKEGSKSQTWLGEQLGISQPSVSAWLSGRSRPEAHHRRAIERVMATQSVKVPEDDWMTDDERAVANGTPRRRRRKAA